MKRAYGILPCYAGDVSGACSALYELEGMVIIHDPSGCNSTYNTHDETRWFSRDSLIFLSGLSEMDAILGGDQKLIEEISQTAISLQPKFIALTSSPIPYLNGQDLGAIARLVERKTGIPCFSIPTNGMRNYIYGMENAFIQLERRFVTNISKKKSGTVNILGMTPLDYGPTDAKNSLCQWLNERGWQVCSCWGMGCSLEELSRAGEAEVNLVVSAGGFLLAQDLKKRFGTPYVIGIPIGEHGEMLESALKTAVATGEDQSPCLFRGRGLEIVTLIGEPVTMGSLAAAVGMEYKINTRVLCPLGVRPSLLAQGDLRDQGEADIRASLKKSNFIVADPMYRSLCPTDTKFYPIPHQAFSGRSGWKSAKNLISMEVSP